jgi:hypothetical protein
MKETKAREEDKAIPLVFLKYAFSCAFPLKQKSFFGFFVKKMHFGRL